MITVEQFDGEQLPQRCAAKPRKTFKREEVFPLIDERPEAVRRDVQDFNFHMSKLSSAFCKYNRVEICGSLRFGVRASANLNRHGLRREAQRHAAFGRAKSFRMEIYPRACESGVAASLCHRTP